MKRNVWCWAAILGATTLAPIPGLAQETIPTAVVVKVLSDSSYIVQIRGRRLIVITESVFQRLLQADEERRGLKDKLRGADSVSAAQQRSEEHTSELQSPDHLVCRLLLEKKKEKSDPVPPPQRPCPPAPLTRDSLPQS